MTAIVYLLFFFSGAAGLIYQVIWVRQFGNVFGNNVYSASLVIAVFMCGLGLGSYLAGNRCLLPAACNREILSHPPCSLVNPNVA